MSRLEKGDLLKRSEKFIHNVVSLLKDDLKRPKTIYENDLSRQLFRSVTSI